MRKFELVQGQSTMLILSSLLNVSAFTVASGADLELNLELRRCNHINEIDVLMLNPNFFRIARCLKSACR